MIDKYIHKTKFMVLILCLVCVSCLFGFVEHTCLSHTLKTPGTLSQSHLNIGPFHSVHQLIHIGCLVMYIIYVLVTT